MKQLLLVLPLSLSIAASQAQTYPVGAWPSAPSMPAQYTGLDKAKAAQTSGIIQVPGRTVNYRWDAATNQWSKNPQLVTTSYNSAGYRTLELTADSATQHPISRITNAYNTFNKLLSETTEKWNSGVWENTYRSQYMYNSSQEKIIERLYQSWKAGIWQNSSRTVLAYNHYNADTLNLNQQWRNDGWITENTSLQRYIIYTTSGQYKEIFSNYFDVLSASFKGYSKRTYSYSSLAAKEPAEAIEQLLKNNVYINNLRILYTYDSQSRFLRYEEQSWVADNWVPSRRVNYTYLANAPGYTYEIQQYQQGSWINESRITNAYDAYGNATGYLYELWKNGAWETQIDDRLLLRYDADNNVVRRVRLIYDINNTSSNKFVYSSMSTYGDYQRIILGVKKDKNLAAHTEAYPNPTDGTCMLILPEAVGNTGHKAEVLNSLGQVVQTYNLEWRPGQKGYQLDFKPLPSGPYTIRIQTTEGFIIKPVVHQ